MSPPFQVVSGLSAPAGKVNEDAWGTAHGAVWVIDGATDVGPERYCPGPTDAAWFAASVSRHLEDVRFAEVSVPLALTQALKRSKAALINTGGRLPPGRHGPTASIAVASTCTGDLEIGILGDCKAIAVGIDGSVTVYGTSPITALDRELTRAVQQLRERGLTEVELARRVAALVREERSRANQEGGYWILDINGFGVPFLELQRLPGSEIESLLLLTDGFYRLVDTYRAYTDQSLARAISLRGLESLIGELRCIEEADPTCTRYPRVKPKDDATAVFLRSARSLS